MIALFPLAARARIDEHDDCPAGGNSSIIPSMSDKNFDTFLSTVMGGILVVLITLPLTGSVPVFVESAAYGRPINNALWYLLVGFVAGLMCLFYRYLSIINGATGQANSTERRRFLTFRRQLESGGTASAVYTGQLGRLLGAVDRFFGDAARPAAAHWRAAFRVQAEVPLWSVSAYDRCLFLALVYPVGAAFLIWVVSGEAGSLEQALGLKAEVEPMGRFSALVRTVIVLFAFVRFSQLQDLKQSLFFGAIGVIYASYGSFAVALLAAVAATAAVRAAFAVSIVVVIAGVYVAASADTLAGIGAFAVAITVAVAIRKGQSSASHLFLTVGLLVFCLAVPTWSDLADVPADRTGMLLFLGMLTLLNAPFDWISLGMTRVFLRKGLELTGGWPWLLALIDAALATVLIVALSATMVIGVQAFDMLVARSSGAAPLPLAPLFEGLSNEPAAPEYWWVYVLLLSTLFPSLVNLVVGGCSIVRGLPGVMPWLVTRLPQERPKGERAVGERYLVAGVLTVHWGLGIAFAIGAQALLICGILGGLMPTLGAGLLELMQELAAMELPQQVLKLVSPQ